jgi:hypothetical protein
MTPGCRRRVRDQYPFLLLYMVVFIPSFTWIYTVEGIEDWRSWEWNGLSGMAFFPNSGPVGSFGQVRLSEILSN